MLLIQDWCTTIFGPDYVDSDAIFNEPIITNEEDFKRLSMFRSEPEVIQKQLKDFEMLFEINKHAQPVFLIPDQLEYNRFNKILYDLKGEWMDNDDNNE